MKAQTKFLIVWLFVILTCPIWLAFVTGLPNAKSNYVDYVISQEIEFDNDHPNLYQPPYVSTYVWQDGEIIYSEWVHIDSDSTVIKERVKVEEWVQMIKNNEVN